MKGEVWLPFYCRTLW